MSMDRTAVGRAIRLNAAPGTLVNAIIGRRFQTFEFLHVDNPNFLGRD